MYKQIISSTQVSAWTAGTPAVSVGTVQGCSIKLINQTQYELQVFNGTEQIDTVPPFSFIVAPYENDLNVSIDKSNASAVLVSPYQYVAFKRIKGVVSYQTGSTTFVGNTPVAGTVNVGNTTLNVTTATGDAVTIAGTVDIGNSPAVTINGTPNVNVATGTVDANITGSVTLDSNSTVLNSVIPQNSLVYIGKTVATITDLVAGGSFVGAPSAGFAGVGIYDGVICTIESTAGIASDYTVSGHVSISSAIFGEGYVNSPDLIWSNPYTGGNLGATLAYIASLPGNESIAFDQVYSQWTNNSGATIASDTVTVQLWGIKGNLKIANPTSSPVPTQSQYTPTTYNLGSYTFGSTAVPAQSVGASQFTESISMSSVIKAQLLVQQTASTGFVTANPGAGIGFQLQGSNDNSTWYVISGDANNPTSMDIINNGVWYQAADQTAIPAIISGYAYIRWAIYLVNGTTASVTMSESCTVYMQTLEG